MYCVLRFKQRSRSMEPLRLDLELARIRKQLNDGFFERLETNGEIFLNAHLRRRVAGSYSVLRCSVFDRVLIEEIQNKQSVL
jgi:hypothetical protein